MNYNYTVEQKMDGQDLYGLPCRVPEPTERQAKCSHTEVIIVDDGYTDEWSGEFIHEYKRIEGWLYEDVPGTNNIRCSRCGYTRRY